MQKKIIYLSLLGLVIVIAGCASLKTFLSGSTTNLTSSSIQAANVLRAAGVTVFGTAEGSNWVITPSKISGKIMSVVFTVNGQEDEGIVPFGNGRPDIAPAQSTLYDFDLSHTTVLQKDVVGLKPGFVGGQSNQMILLFGYFDVEFLQGTTTKKIRFCYGDSTPYVRGDKLMYNPSGEVAGKYYWYDTIGGTFVSESSTRPSSPEVNTNVKNFTDPIRPNAHYYNVGVMLRNNRDYDGTIKSYISLLKSLVEDRSLSFTVDFDLGNAVVFNSVTSEAAFNALTDVQLLQKFDMKQNTARWQDTGLYSSVSFESTPKF
ncbi:MAG: hypothetical protein WCT39_04940 [Candidatus Margulisiibacteriota bacterium]